MFHSMVEFKTNFQTEKFMNISESNFYAEL